MLNNDFFTFKIIEQSETEFSVSLKLDPQNKIYEGHFPGMPVTPGVCQVQMVNEVLNACLKSDYKLVKAIDIKFMNMIIPEKITELDLQLTIKGREEDTISLNTLMHKDGVKYLKMRSTYQAV